MIEIIDVTRRFGSLEAVNHLSLKLPEKQIIGLLGQNGAGKTTTLKMLTGCLPPSSGQILIDGLDMMTDSRECKRRIGYLPEQPPLYDEMTVEDYLIFVCRLKEVRQQAIRAHVEDIMAMCGLSDMKGRRLGSFSKGYRQRVGIAQALCGDPPLLILDEPTVGLDPKQVTEIRELIRIIGQDHTVIFSSHILSEVQQLCSRAVILHKGRLIKELALQAAENSGHDMRLRFTVLGSQKRVAEALRALPGFVSMTELPAEEKKCCSFEITFTRTETDPRIALFRLLNMLDAPLLALNPVRDDLEDIFLRATSEEL